MRTRFGYQVVLAICLAGLTACEAPQPGSAETTAETATATQPALVRSVRTITAVTGELIADRLTSVTIEPRQESRVASAGTGRVKEVVLREGQVVAAGEVVIRLDEEALRLQLINAELALQTARINLERSERSSQENSSQLTVQLQAARSSFDFANQQLQEGRALFEAGGIAQSQVTNLEAQRSSAQANLIAAQDALARSERSIDEDIALLQVQVSQAETQLQQAQTNLRDAQITAPFAGEVAEVFVEEGEFITAGAPAFRLVSQERQLARFAVPPLDVQALLAQESIQIRFQGLDYPARIIRSSTAPGDQRLVNLTAELLSGSIPSGSVGQLSYQIPLAQGILIPSAALSTEAGRTYIFRFDEGIAVRQEVSIVAESGGQAGIEGITEGDIIIFPLPADLRSGMAVREVE